MILTSSERNDTAAAGAAPSRANYGATFISDKGGDGRGQDDSARDNAPELYSNAGPTSAEELMVSAREPHRTSGTRLVFALVVLSAAAGLFYCSSYRWRSNTTTNFIQEYVPMEGQTECARPQGSFQGSCNSAIQLVNYNENDGLCKFQTCCARGENGDEMCTLNVGTYQPSDSPDLTTNRDGCLEGSGWTQYACTWDDSAGSYCTSQQVQCSAPQGSFQYSCNSNVQEVTYDGNTNLCTFKTCCARGAYGNEVYTYNQGTYQPSETPDLTNNGNGCLEGSGWSQDQCTWEPKCGSFCSPRKLNAEGKYQCGD